VLFSSLVLKGPTWYLQRTLYVVFGFGPTDVAAQLNPHAYSNEPWATICPSGWITL